MTLTLTRRRTALVLVAIMAILGAYVFGASRSRGAAAATPTRGSMAGFSTAQLAASPVSTGPGIHVVGRANVAGTPDTLRLELSVVATGSSVSDALASANRSAAAVQKSLLGNGVARKDLQTSGLNITPEYEYSNNKTPRLTGYQVSESVTAKLRNLATAGGAIGAAVSAGGNAVRVNGISLDLEETGALVTSARDKAFVDAKAKAEQYARAAGRNLGDVVTIAEDISTPSPIPMPYAGGAAAAQDMAKVPIQPGSQDVSVSVTVVFELR